MKKEFLLIIFILLAYSIYSNNNKNDFDFERVKKTWLSWVNEERKKNNLHPYKFHNKLNQTTYQWCLINQKRGEISHKRDLNNSKFYDYQEIKN